MSITCESVVVVLQQRRLSTTAKLLAEITGTDSRAIATALRSAVNDGRVKITYRKGIGHYRFKRLTPNCGISGSKKGDKHES